MDIGLKPMRMTSRKQLLNIAMSCHDLTSGVVELMGGRGFNPHLGHKPFCIFSLHTQTCARLDSVSKEERMSSRVYFFENKFQKMHFSALPIH